MKPYPSPLSKWLVFSIVKAPPFLFSRVLMDLGVMMPLIFIMTSFCMTSMSYAPLFDNFDDIVAPSLLVEMLGA
jgi:hypothetical protein